MSKISSPNPYLLLFQPALILVIGLCAVGCGKTVSLENIPQRSVPAAAPVQVAPPQEQTRPPARAQPLYVEVPVTVAVALSPPIAPAPAFSTLVVQRAPDEKQLARDHAHGVVCDVFDLSDDQKRQTPYRGSSGYSGIEIDTLVDCEADVEERVVMLPERYDGNLDRWFAHPTWQDVDSSGSVTLSNWSLRSHSKIFVKELYGMICAAKLSVPHDGHWKISLRGDSDARFTLKNPQISGEYLVLDGSSNDGIASFMRADEEYPFLIEYFQGSKIITVPEVVWIDVGRDRDFSVIPASAYSRWEK